MSVLIEEQVSGRVTRPARRMGTDVMRRPPHGRPGVAGRPKARPAACAIEHPTRRWPRVAALALTAGAAITTLGIVIGGLAEGLAPSVPERTALVTVAPGETLWDVASKYAPDSDPRAVVDRIEELNGVTAGAVTAGYPLSVPVQAGVVTAARS